MATTLRTLAVTFACFATSVLDCAETQPLTSSDQKAVQEFFGVSESESGVLEVGGWRESGDSEGAPMQVFGYVSLIRPEMLLDRLCIVENRWGQGLIVEGKMEWVSELFKIDYEVWEPTTPGCVVSDRSALPERISVKADIDGPTLLRIIDGSQVLLEKGLAFIDDKYHANYINDRLLELQISGFEYRARFGSRNCEGVYIHFSESQSRFQINTAERWVC